MGNEIVRLTREQLYELVWSKPLRTLATEFGISDVGIAKACSRLGVPRPEQGHWPRVALGKTPDRPPLPAAKPDQNEPLVVTKRDPAEPPPPRREVPEVPVREKLVRPHPAIAALVERIGERKGKEDEMLCVWGGGHASVFRVSRRLSGRALRILDALVRAVVDRGWRVLLDAETGHRCRLVAADGDSQVEISIIERMNQTEHQLTDEEREQKKRLGWSFAPKFDQHPGQRLTLRLFAIWGALHRQNWVDSDRRELEEALGEVVVAIEDGFTALRIKRAELEAERLALQEAQRRRLAEEERARHQKLLEDDLRAMAARWKEAQVVREFLDAVEAAIVEEDRSAGFLARLAWARQAATSLDPLHEPHRIAKVLEPRRAPG